MSGQFSQACHIKYVANNANHLISILFQFGNPLVQLFLTDINCNDFCTLPHKMFCDITA